MSFNPQKAQLALSSKELLIIDEELKRKNMQGMPDESTLAQISKIIYTETGLLRSISDLAEQIRPKAVPSIAPLLLQTPKEVRHTSYLPESQVKVDRLESKIGSMFKQFEDYPSNQKFQTIQKDFKSAYDLAGVKSKRKIRPTETSNLIEEKGLEDKVFLIDSRVGECHAIFERRNRKSSQKQATNGVNQNILWIYNEYFYSNFDRVYFHQEDQLKKLFIELKLNPQKMTFKQQRMIRRILPSPKLFTNQFAYSQQEKLYEFRGQARMNPRNFSKMKDDLQLNVNKEVIALHPVCGHLHSGTILAIYKQNQYMVKFGRPELGTQKIVDINMMSRPSSGPSRAVVQNVDNELMALTIKLLQFKADLLLKLKQYNKQAERMKSEEIPLNNKFLQEYGWVGSTINILTLGLRHIIARFRMRGLSSSNQQKVGKNFAAILLNPLTLIGKNLKQSSENSDLNASQQIKGIISAQKEKKSDTYTVNFLQKHMQVLKECNWEPEKRQKLEKLLKSCICLLVNLKCQPRSFNADESRAVNQLGQLTNQSFPEHFNEIYQALHSITGKIAQI